MLYPKISGPWKRNLETNKLRPGQWSIPEFGVLEDTRWTFTEKIDGTNVRLLWDGYDISFGGRTDRAQFHPDLSKHLIETFPAEKFEQLFGDKPVVLFGEGYGAGIQGGGDYRQDKSFILFDIFIDDKLWLSPYEVVNIGQELGIPHVGVWQSTLNEGIQDVAGGLKSRFKDGFAEGVVGHPLGGLLDRQGRRISVKLKHSDLYQLL